MSEIQAVNDLSRSQSISKKWGTASYVLAALYLASVIGSLIVQHRLNREYRQTLEKSRAWGERNKHYVKFAQEAFLISTAGNSAVPGAKSEEEWKIAREVRDAFDRQFDEDQTDVKNNVSGADRDKLLSDLNVVKTGMEGLTAGNGQAVFAFAKGRKRRGQAAASGRGAAIS